MTRRLSALLLLVGGFVVFLPAASALASPPAVHVLPPQVQAAAPFLMSPMLNGGTGRAFH